MTIRNVLKAPTEPIGPKDFASLQYPIWGSPKEDGIRCIIHPQHGPCSQRMKPIPNHIIRETLKEYGDAIIGLDGELVTFNEEGEMEPFNDIQSKVMSRLKHPRRWKFLVFDFFLTPNLAYTARMAEAQMMVENLQDCNPEAFANIEWMHHTLLQNANDVVAYENHQVSKGKEGIMLNHPRGIYKQGRSTFNEGYLLKVKRFMDDEAIVTGVELEMENCNAASVNAAGHQVRSKHTSGMVPKPMVGKLICQWKGKEIKVGSGLTGMEKSYWYNHPDQIIGKTITFKYQVHGMKDLPRAPIFKGVRRDV